MKPQGGGGGGMFGGGDMGGMGALLPLAMIGSGLAAGFGKQDKNPLDSMMPMLMMGMMMNGQGGGGGMFGGGMDPGMATSTATPPTGTHSGSY